MEKKSIFPPPIQNAINRLLRQPPPTNSYEKDIQAEEYLKLTRQIYKQTFKNKLDPKPDSDPKSK